MNRPLRWWHDQLGITGLETAIVLIAFVVVASVFAFAVLSTGLYSSEKAKQTIVGTMEEAESSLVIDGSIIGYKNSSGNTIDSIVFPVSNALQTRGSVNLSRSGTESTLVTYFDDNQFVNLSSSDWLVTWIIGSGNLLNSGERAEIRVTLTGLGTLLGPSIQFTIEVKPTVGALLIVDKTTPGELESITILR